ncbi:MAG: HAMP domain-containing histidine kinase [Deltaproteobacteria bacterium]|nr:HAMP domain-containing histidine kinase [Deltaproteobacteria bacterium]
MALFLGHKEGHHVLPIAAQDGLNWDEVNSVHFNWRKAGLPVDSKAFNTLEWLTDVSASSKFPDNYVIKGIKGCSKEKFSPAVWLLPVGRLYRGVLLVGDWKDSSIGSAVPLSDQFGGRNFLQGIGHILVTYAISKLALHASVQHDKRRDLIVALTAHSIRASLQRFWDAVERVRHYWQKPQYTERVKRAMDEMITIIKSMKKNVALTMASPETAVTPQFHSSEMEIKDINLAAVLHNCAHIFESQARDKEINIVIQDDVDELPLVRGDRYMLELLFSNILDNAIKYSKVNKEVRVYTRQDSQNIVVIIIEDLGWGIPEEDLTQIFEPGFKSQKVAKFQSRGIGLGAHQARQFVRLHGGQLWATSQAAFDGAPLSFHIVRFHIRLPVMQPAKKVGGKNTYE